MTIYRHYKGGLYELVTEAQHSETFERMIVYKNIRTGDVWARPAVMFHSEVAPGKLRFEMQSQSSESPLRAAIAAQLVCACGVTYDTGDSAQVAVHTLHAAQDPPV